VKTKGAIKKLQRLLLTGFFVIAPLSLTFILLAWFVSFVDSSLSPVIGLIGRPVPGLGLICAVLLMLGAGMLAGNIVGRHILEYIEEALLKVPVLSGIYKTIKQMSDVFAPSQKDFRSVVLVEYPRPEVLSLGFVTNEVDVLGKKHYSVYIPTNHMYIGDTILAPAEQVVFTDLTQQQGIQAMISAGAALPESIGRKKQKD
jgi:uncharacterized membrane protein